MKIFLAGEGKGEGKEGEGERGSRQDATGITKDNYGVIFTYIFFTSHLFFRGKGRNA